MADSTQSDGAHDLTVRRARLFRHEAIEHVTMRLYGTVLLARPLSWSILTAVSVSAAVAAAAFLWSVSYTRHVEASGTLEPGAGLIRISAPRDGVISSAKAGAQDAPVGAGEVVYSIDTATVDQVGSHEAIAAFADARLKSFADDTKASDGQWASKISAMSSNIAELRGLSAQLARRREIQSKRLTLARETYQRYSDLKNQDFISGAQLHDKMAEVYEQEQKLEELNSQADEMRRQTEAAESSLHDADIQSNREHASIERSRLLEQQQIVQNDVARNILVKSPIAGTIALSLVNVGERVTAGQQLAAIVPAGSPIEVRLFVPSRSAGFLKAGMKTSIKFDSFPYQKFGQYPGVVKAVAAAALSQNAFSKELLSPTSERYYLVTVKLDSEKVVADGKSYDLTPGMTVSGTIELDRRRLIDWIVSPLYVRHGEADAE